MQGALLSANVQACVGGCSDLPTFLRKCAGEAGNSSGLREVSEGRAKQRCSHAQSVLKLRCLASGVSKPSVSPQKAPPSEGCTLEDLDGC